jgi:hypothetical protein
MMCDVMMRSISHPAHCPITLCCIHHQLQSPLPHRHVQLPAGGGYFNEDLIVRQLLRRVVAALVAEEALLLLEGAHLGVTALGTGHGRDGSGGGKAWALW